jgi:hypothetical protein
MLADRGIGQKMNSKHVHFLGCYSALEITVQILLHLCHTAFEHIPCQK